MRQTMKIGKLVQEGAITIKTGPFGTQLKAAEYQETGTPVLNVKNLGYGSINPAKLDHLGPATVERLRIHLLQQGDIVFGRKGAVDRHAYIDNESDGWMQGSDCIRLRVETDVINPRFLSYYFLTAQHKAFMISMCSHGTTMASLNQKILEQIDFPCPERKYQDKIVDVLERIDEKGRINRKINENLFQQAQALYKYRFVNMQPFDGVMPGNWHLGTVSEIIELHDSKRIPLSSRERADLSKIYPYYGATSVMDYVDSYLFDGIYLLLGEDGTVVDSKGFPILQYVEGKFWVNNHAHIITGKNGFSVELLYLLFSLTSVQSIVTGAVQPKISQANLNKVPVIVPSEDELKAFDTTVQPIFAQIRNLRAENDRLATIRDTLLPKLMSGELDVSELDL